MRRESGMRRPATLPRGGYLIVLSWAVVFPQTAEAVRLRAVPSSVLLGRGRPALVRILGRSDRGPLAIDAIVASTSAGSLGEVRPTSDGRFAIDLHPPGDFFPQVAVVTVLDGCSLTGGDAPDVGTVAVSYVAEIALRGTTEPHASMRMKVGDEIFGPVEADASGRFVLFVRVPPGHRYAEGISSDALGNESRSTVDLFLPSVQRLHGFLYPPQAVVGSPHSDWLIVTSVEASGRPAGRRLHASAERGRVGKATVLAPGVWRFAYRPPDRLGQGKDRIHVTTGEGGPVLVVEVPLEAGRPSNLRTKPARLVALADGRERLHVSLALADGSGNVLREPSLTLSLDGAPLAFERGASPGVFDVLLPARERAGEGSIAWTASPPVPTCLWPELRAIGGRWTVVDERGLPCRTRWRLVRSDGTIVTDGRHGALVEAVDREAVAAVLRESGRIVVEGGAPVCARLGARDAPVPLLAGELRAHWVRPPPLRLRLRFEGIHEGAREVAILTDARVDAAALEVGLASGRPVDLFERGGLLLVRIPTGEAEDLIVTHRPTGVSAWLRLE